MLAWKTYTIKARESSGVVILELGGKIVEGKACEQVREAVKQLLADHKMILLNLKKVRHIDNHGTAALLSACNAAWQQHAELKLVKPNPEIREALDNVFLTVFLDVYNDEKEALESFKQWLFESRLRSTGLSQGNAGPAESPLPRRSPRIPLATSVAVGWENARGAYVNEQAETAVVSAHGALLRMKHELPGRQLIELSRPGDAQTLAHVIYSGLPTRERWTPVAVQLVVPNQTFWGSAVRDALVQKYSSQQRGNGGVPGLREQDINMQLPSLGELQKVARHSNSAYGFVYSLRMKHPQVRALTVEEVLLRLRDRCPHLLEQFPWLTYPVRPSDQE